MSTAKLNEFLFATRSTWVDAGDMHMWPPTKNLLHAALGLAGEAGEVIDIIKKDVFTPARLAAKGIDADVAIKEELGDVLYYWCRICDICGYDPDEIMGDTLDKLCARYNKEPEKGEAV